jgi:hypothetical protein
MVVYPMARKRDKNLNQRSLIRDQQETVREALRDIKREDADRLREAPRDRQPDEAVLLEGLSRLEQSGLMFAFHEKKRTMRILTNPADEQQAIALGFSVWSPRDMFEYVHLPADQREKLRSFKRVFAIGGFEWKTPE